MNNDLSQKELAQKMQNNARDLLNQDGYTNLFVHNLENFAYRYLETSTDKGIKCQLAGAKYFVSSCEESIIEALKWENTYLKKELIQLCKAYPGKKSSMINIYLELGSIQQSETCVDCYASVSWKLKDSSEQPQVLSQKNVRINFEDPLELRNTHAKYLEEVASIF